MSTQPNAMDQPQMSQPQMDQSQIDQAQLDSAKIAPANIPATRVFYWSLRREFWEYRSLYIAPLAIAGVALLGFVITTLGRGFSTQNLVLRRSILEEANEFPSLLIMATALIVAVFYCLDTLHAERRDRSILFWKSLPVSDLTTVLAKASIPIVFFQLLTFAITFVMQLIMLLISTLALWGSGLSAGMLWSHSLHLSIMLLYHLVAIHGLVFAPYYAWLLLVSAWARRAALLWATLPLLAVGLFERIVFRTSYFVQLLSYPLLGGAVGGSEGAGSKAGSMTADILSMASPVHFLLSPSLWIGLFITAVFLAAAARLRRYREPI